MKDSAKRPVANVSFPKLRSNKKTLQIMAYENLKKQIIQGNLKGGQRLSEESLANSFNVSRTPIREAIFQLEKEGLVRKNPHNGFFVREFTKEDIEEISRIRLALEPLLVDLVIERIDQGLIDTLQENIRSCKELLSNPQIKPSLLYLITEFHEILYKASSSPKLSAILSGLGGDALMNRCLAVKIKGVYEDFVDQHEKLLKALIVKDKDRAEEIMKVHIEVGKQCALKILNEIG